ncbi:MAG: carbohydrate ABC transporter permease [Clostridia bacterium]|nr:carbohydrate ABC transporter permease [Clostridia bacterium]
MIKKKTFGSILFDIINCIILIFICLVSLYPFLYVLFASFSNAGELATHTGLLLRPKGFSVAAYSAVMENQEIWTGYLNTLIYVIGGTVVNLIFTLLGAYVLSRNNFYWNKILLPMALFTMFFNGGLIPNFLLVQNLGIYNTRWAMILPGAINTWNLFIMRTNLKSIPSALTESAQIDGANDWQTLFKIVLPLSMPIIAVMILYYGVAHWNAWFDAMIYLRKRELFPLQLFIREILMASKTEEMTLSMDLSAGDMERVSETVKYSTIVVATVPILCVYPFLQKYFVKGVMIGAVKG